MVEKGNNHPGAPEQTPLHVAKERHGSGTRVTDPPRSAPWWGNPPMRVAWVIACIALFAAHKPWALRTPQFFAEDGAIFMVQDQELGARAILQPYMGYLNVVPRLTAWIASHTLDPRWWPGFYNGIALLGAALVFIRLASPRLRLTGKAWCAVALAMVVHTGETYLTVTNIQWYLVFLLMLQLVMDDPVTIGEEAIDLTTVVVAGLTGPFAVLLLPLYGWSWWRRRSRASATRLLGIAACALVQGFFILKTSPHYDYQNKPYEVVGLLDILGNRLVAWPVLGQSLTDQTPPVVLTILGLAAIAVYVRALWTRGDSDARRIFGAAALILMAAAVYRIRPDTWVPHDMEHGDRYFFVPRVLLTWLLILEFRHRWRVIRIAAPVVAIVALVMNGRTHVVSAPRNYHWEAQCDALRSGTPAQLRILPDWVVDYPGRRK